jgi:hypothetical protein
MAAHQFHKADSAWHAARFSVRTIEDARGFFNGAEKSECARNEADIVVDRLWDTDD